MTDYDKLATHCTGDLSARRVVFLHGFMGSGRDWDGVIASLPDYRCITVDLPGHGQSRGLSDTAMTLAGTSRLLTETLRDFEPYTLVGYSLGGRLALHHALCSAARLDGLIIESAHCGLQDEAARAARRKWDQSVAVRLETEPLSKFLADWYEMGLFQSLRGCAGFEAMLARRGVNDSAELARSMRLSGTGTMMPLWAQWAAYAGARVHLMVGELDEKYRRLSAEMLTVNPRATRAVLAGVGHNTHLEDRAAFVVQLRGCLLF